MRSIQKFPLFSLIHLHQFSSSSSNKPLLIPLLSPIFCNTTITLTEHELNKINILIPRLCIPNNLPRAIHLVHTALLANPPPNSISFSILVHSITSDLTRPMSFLTRIKHTNSSVLPIITKMFLSSYFIKGQPRNAVKVFNRVTRPDCPSDPDFRFYAIAAAGFCRNGMLLESLKPVRLMAGIGFVPGPDLRTGYIELY